MYSFVLITLRVMLFPHAEREEYDVSDLPLETDPCYNLSD